MNNKEFIASLSSKIGKNEKETTKLVNALLQDISFQLEDENSVMVPNFGLLDTKKKLERVLINPTSKQKMLVPPKMVVNFKPSQTLKDKINQ